MKTFTIASARRTALLSLRVATLLAALTPAWFAAAQEQTAVDVPVGGASNF